ncbi:HK97 gp10 family phage protein [Vibrio astriarenae]|uniref:HK97 gp10 family phage protein n=1 Tax=Vibrio astriarenae TaxID=1481923 RepID=UPI003735650C
MIEQQIDLNKLAEAIGSSVTNCVGLIASELADVAIEKAPVLTGRMVRSINVNDGNNPKLTDTYRSQRVEFNVAGIKNQQKMMIRNAVRRRMRRRGMNRQREVWWLVAAAPYSEYVHNGAAFRQRIKNMPRRQQRAAWANMRNKMAQRGQSEYQRSSGQGFNFFSFSPAEVARAARRAASLNQSTQVST